MSVYRVALLTVSGLALCLSSAVEGLIERYNEIDPEIEVTTYQSGCHSFLTGNFVVVDKEARARAAVFHRFGGSPIGGSRVKLTNAKNLVERGLVVEGKNPLEKTAEQLRRDGVDVLYTIGGDDTNTTAADLTAYPEEHDYHLTVIGLPKTIDNDVMPIRRSLGAWTTAEEVSEYTQSVIGEHRPNPRTFIVREIMGRNCGWLTVTDSREYHEQLKTQGWVPSIGLSKEHWDIHAIFLPEMALGIEAGAARLKKIVDEQGDVSIFPSEGTGIPEIIAEMEIAGVEVQRDPFGHVKFDTISPGQWSAKQFAPKIEAEKIVIQKSGYFPHSSRANADDLRLIKSMTDLAVECTLRGKSGVIDHDKESGDRLRAIPFPRIADGKPFDITQKWFTGMMAKIGQDVKPAAR